MDSRIQDQNVFDLSEPAGGVHLVGFYIDVASGEEADDLDAYLQVLTVRGNRVIDSDITVEIDSNPPVTGWILYQETAT